MVLKLNSKINVKIFILFNWKRIQQKLNNFRVMLLPFFVLIFVVIFSTRMVILSHSLWLLIVILLLLHLGKIFSNSRLCNWIPSYLFYWMGNLYHKCHDIFLRTLPNSKFMLSNFDKSSCFVDNIILSVFFLFDNN